MKTITLFLGLLLTTSLMAQERVSYQQPLEYSTTGTVILREILHYPGKSKEELYQLGEEWFARKFPGELLPFDSYSENRDKLIGRGIFSYRVSYHFGLGDVFAEVSYVLTIAVKDEKIKVEAEELFIYGPTAIITVEDEFAQPKPAHEVIGDKALYKRNGKPRALKRKHKEQILTSWYDLLDSVDGFFNSSQEEEDW